MTNICRKSCVKIFVEIQSLNGESGGVKNSESKERTLKVEKKKKKKKLKTQHRGKQLGHWCRVGRHNGAMASMKSLPWSEVYYFSSSLSMFDFCHFSVCFFDFWQVFSLGFSQGPSF